MPLTPVASAVVLCCVALLYKWLNRADLSQPNIIWEAESRSFWLRGFIVVWCCAFGLQSAWAQGPANDNYANAQVLAGNILDVVGLHSGATSETFEPYFNPQPPEEPYPYPSRSIWYKWISPYNGYATFSARGMSLAGEQVDTNLKVFTGPSLGSLSLVAYNNDLKAPDITTFQAAPISSRVNFMATANIAYYISVDVDEYQNYGESGVRSFLSANTFDPVGVLAAVASGPSNGQATLTWSAVSGYTQYKIYRSTTPAIYGATPLATVTATSYTNIGLALGSTYYYTVKATQNNGTGEVTTYGSNEVSATPLAAPTGLTATPGAGRITLGWGAVTGATKYTIFRTTDNAPTIDSFTEPALGDRTGTQFIDSNVAAGTKYSYIVKAVNAGGSSSASAILSATMLAPPGVPTGFTATPGDATISLKWNAVSGATYYDVWSSSDNVNFAVIFNNVTATSTVHNSLVNGRSYYYKVSAANSGGDGSVSGSILGIPIAPPQNMVATAGTGKVVLTWSASTGATDYNIYRSQFSGPASSGNYGSVLASTTARTYTDETAPNGTLYHYVVKALNASGMSAASNEEGATAIAPPEDVTLQARTSQINLTWKAVTGATGYNIYRSQFSGPDSSGNYGSVLASTTALSYTNNSALNGTLYHYVVRATNTIGQSSNSVELSALPLAAPTSLVASPANARVSLSWTASSGASSYKIFRVSTSGAAATPPAFDYNAPYAIPSGTSFLDSSVSNGAKYYYEVRAYHGNNSESQSSNTASATPFTPAPPTLTATASTSRVLLTWSIADASTSFKLFRVSAPTPTAPVPNFDYSAAYVDLSRTGSGNSMTFDDVDVVNGTTYYYEVRAYNQGDTSISSNRVMATPMLPIAPVLSAVPGNKQVALSWTRSPSATSYNLYRVSTANFTDPTPAFDSASLYINVAAPTSGTGPVTFLNTGARVVNGTTYHYMVRAVVRVTKPSGTTNVESLNSNTAKARPRIPDAPTNLTAIAYTSHVVLTWTAPADTSGFGNYNVYRVAAPSLTSPPPAFNYTTPYRLVSGTKLDNTLVTNGTKYYYEVRATNTGGESASSNRATGTPIAAPTGLVSSEGNQQVSLTWNKVVGATSYGVKRDNMVLPNVDVPDTGAATLTYTDDNAPGGLSNGTTYSYKVFARNTIGTSDDSSSVTGLPTAPVPPAQPLNLSAVAGTGKVLLEWDRVDKATGYKIYRSTTAGAVGAELTPGPTDVSPARITYLDNDPILVNGTRYFYAVRANNVAGDGPSSDEVRGTPITAPTGLKAAVGDRQVKLTWNRVTGATSYGVRRDGVVIAGANIPHTGAATLSYLDSDNALNNGGSYQYVVFAQNTIGTSDDSVVVNASPSIPPGKPLNLEAVAGAGRIILSWTTSQGATGHNIKRSITPGGPYTVIDTGATSGYNDTDVDEDTTYYYVVSAVNGSGAESADSDEASAKPLPPSGLITKDLSRQTPTDLANALTGNGLTLSNVQYKGVNRSAGTFRGGAGIIGIAKGVVLGTGNIALVTGPNTSGGQGEENGLPGDAELGALAAGNAGNTTPQDTFDATALEFDFVPRQAHVTLRYVFASEEYNEYVGSQFNDVFGFFLNGTNVATLPGTDIGICINNVNGGSNAGGDPTNPDLFINNDVNGGAANINTGMDGFTVVLTVRAQVNAGQVNHFKLAIADVGDAALDSNVFLEASSLSSASVPELPTLFNTGVDNAHKPLDPGTIDAHYNGGDTTYQAVVRDESVWPISEGLYVPYPIGARWISPSATSTGQGAGTFSYSQSFQLPAGMQIASLQGRYAVDDEMTDITVNGTSIGPVPADTHYDTWTPFTIDGSRLTSGSNTVTFTFSSQSSSLDPGRNAAGLIVEWTGASVVPPPPPVPNPPIPQGATGTLPASGSACPIDAPTGWQILSPQVRVIGSALAPNGWTVVVDQTTNPPQLTVSVPPNAVVAPGYQVRFNAGQSCVSALFDVVPATTTGNAAPVNRMGTTPIPAGGGTAATGANGTMSFSSNNATPNALNVTDSDAGTGNMTTTLSVSGGTLNAPNGATFVTGNDTTNLTFSGTLTEINAALDGLTFTGTANGTVTLTMATNDNGNTGGAAQITTRTITITVSGITSPPTRVRGVDLIIADEAGTNDQASRNVFYPDEQIHLIDVGLNPKAIFRLTIKNVGNTTDTFRVSGRGDDLDWKVRYFEAGPGGAEVSSLIKSNGYTVTLDAGIERVLRIEVTPRVSLPQGRVKGVPVSARSEIDSLYNDQILAQARQSDVQDPTRATGASIRLANQDVYVGQTISGSASSGTPAVYHWRVQNKGTSTDTFKLTLPAVANGWTVKLFDALINGTDITEEARGGTYFTLPLSGEAPGSPGGFVELRLEVQPDAGMTGDLSTEVTAASVSNPTKSVLCTATTSIAEAVMSAPIVTFTGVTKAVAGSIDNPLHKLTLTLNATENGTPMEEGAFELSFENNVGHNYGTATDPDIRHRAKIFDAGDPAAPWKETLDVMTNAQGQVQVTVLSNDVISQPRLIALKPVAGDTKIVGSVICNFAQATSRRGVPDPVFGDYAGWQNDDAGWSVNIGAIEKPGDLCSGELTMQFDRLPDVFQPLQGHTMKIRMSVITLTDGTQIHDTAEMGRYLRFISAGTESSSWTGITDINGKVGFSLVAKDESDAVAEVRFFAQSVNQWAK